MLVICGTLTIDMHAGRACPGGSLLYGALAASAAGSKPHMIGLHGSDYPDSVFRLLRACGPVDGIVEMTCPSFVDHPPPTYDACGAVKYAKWGDGSMRDVRRDGMYDQEGVTVEHDLRVPEGWRNADTVLLGVMHPHTQEMVLEQFSRPRYIIRDIGNCAAMTHKDVDAAATKSTYICMEDGLYNATPGSLRRASDAVKRSFTDNFAETLNSVIVRRGPLNVTVFPRNFEPGRDVNGPLGVERNDIGCGHAFAGALAARLDAGDYLREAVRCGVAASAVCSMSPDRLGLAAGENDIRRYMSSINRDSWWV